MTGYYRAWQISTVLGVLGVTGCDSIWSPFLVERGACAADPTSCPTDVRPNLVKVQKGGFTMGNSNGELGKNPDESPHMVILTTDFWMAETEVTQQQYRNLMGSSPSYFKGDDLPVESVSWFEAVAYCNALSERESLTKCYSIDGSSVTWTGGLRCTGYRLPTEAEWEYAANPISTQRTVYAGSDTVGEVAWIDTNSASTTHAVKTKLANKRGLYDLSGNVWEWVWDYYLSDYGSLPSTDPVGPATGTQRVIRGGAWSYTATYARVAGRGNYQAMDRNNNHGFRIVRSSP